MCWFAGVGCKVRGVRFKVWAVGCRVSGVGCKVWFRESAALPRG